MRLIPFWWMALSRREKLASIPTTVLLFTILGIMISFAAKPRPEICKTAAAALLDSNDDIEKATSLPQEERCLAYQRRLSFFHKLNSEWAGCLPVAHRGDTQGLNIAAESHFYAQLVDRKCNQP